MEMIRFSQKEHPPWMHRFAVLTAAAATGLIVAGAAVTSTGSGDAVPDWPLSYGSLTPPMIGGILFEHTHRLIAGFTGVLIAILAAWLWIAKPGKTLQRLGIAALAAVILQASLGGLRVLLISTEAVQDAALQIAGVSSVQSLRMAVAVTHAFLAQTILCLLFAIVVLTSPSRRNAPAASPPLHANANAFRLSVFLTGLIFLQLVFGALVRHSGAGLAIPDFPLSFGKIIPPFANLPHDPYAPFPLSPEKFQFQVAVHFAHRAAALLILGLAIFFFARHRKTGKIGKLAAILLLLTSLQMVLGALNIWTGKSVYVTVLHVAVGALLLSCSVAAMITSRSLLQPPNPPQQKPFTRARAYLELTKPRLTLLVLFSAFTGYCLGASGNIALLNLIGAMFGIGLASAGALALNQYAERTHDARMLRTQRRPLPQGRLKPLEALAFGTLLCIFSVIYLAAAVNILTGFLVAMTILTYLFAYTPLKRITYFNTAVGAISGALPIVCGWTAARSDLAPEALALFGILFFWQFPHFLSIALLYREDYRRAGYKMLPLRENGIPRTNRQILLACAALLGVSLFPSLLGLAGTMYLAAALLAGSAFLGCAVSLALYRNNRFARRLMFASFVYPLIVWSFMIYDKIKM